jgi:hypothetical protein
MCRRVHIIKIMGSSSDDWIYQHFSYIFLNYNQYSAIADLHTFQFTIAHTLGLPVFACCLLAMDLNTETITSNYYEVFLSSTTLHISVLICTQLIFTIPFSSLYSEVLLACEFTSLISILYRSHRKQSVLLMTLPHCIAWSNTWNVFTKLLPRNRFHNPILLLHACITGCLSSCCLAMHWSNMLQYICLSQFLACNAHSMIVHTSVTWCELCQEHAKSWKMGRIQIHDDN